MYLPFIKQNRIENRPNNKTFIFISCYFLTKLNFILYDVADAKNYLITIIKHLK